MKIGFPGKRSFFISESIKIIFRRYWINDYSIFSCSGSFQLRLPFRNNKTNERHLILKCLTFKLLIFKLRRPWISLTITGIQNNRSLVYFVLIGHQILRSNISINVRKSPRRIYVRDKVEIHAINNLNQFLFGAHESSLWTELKLDSLILSVSLLVSTIMC